MRVRVKKLHLKSLMGGIIIDTAYFFIGLSRQEASIKV